MHSPQQPQQTPSWKVNLTQKFNKFSKQRHPNINKKINFDQELQKQLNFIKGEREESSKKSRHHILGKDVNKQIRKKVRQEAQENEIQRLDLNQSQRPDEKEYAGSELSHSKSQQGYSGHDSSQNKISSLITNPRVCLLLQCYFRSIKQIQLKQFISACCVQYFKSSPLSQQMKFLLIEQCRPIFCTTDPDYISLNALQLLTKKSQLNHILIQKLLIVKYRKKKEKLQKEYEKILEEIVKQQQDVQEQDQKLNKKRKQIEEQQKQLGKREKTIKNLQKDLVQRQKQMKKLLEQKHKFLSSEFNCLVEKCSKQIQKRASAFQRNSRNKLQLMQKRSNDIRSLVSQFQQKQPLSQQRQQSNKYHNQIMLLKSKLKKQQKQFNILIQQKDHEIHKLEEESKGLLKVNSIMEGKNEKLNKKIKDLNQAIGKNNSEIDNLKRQLEVGQLRVTELEKYILELEHNEQNTKLRLDINRAYQKQQMKKSVAVIDKSSSQANRKKSRQLRSLSRTSNTKNYPKAQKSNQKDLISNFNLIMFHILESFSSYNCQHSQLPSFRFMQFKIEQILLPQSQSLIILCSDLLQSSMQLQITEIDSIIRFVIKLFLARFSFLKFQEISMANNTNKLANIETVDAFVQSIEKNFMKNINTEQKFQLLGQYIQQIYFQGINTQFEINLLLMFLGIDEIYIPEKKKLQSTIFLIYDKFIQSLDSQSQQSSSKQIISFLQDQQLLSFMIFKYISFSTPLSHLSTFIDLVLQLCNFYPLTSQQSPLFKTLSILNNYEYFLNFLLINFTQQNLSTQENNSNKLLQTFEKISIILQRFFYLFGGKVQVQQADIKRLKKLLREVQKNKDLDGSLFKANLQSFVSAISGDKE